MPTNADDRDVLIRYDIWDLNEGKVPEFPVENPGRLARASCMNWVGRSVSALRR